MNTVYLHNSLSKKKEAFVPIEAGKVGFYSCGPTVYDYAHIGNFRTFLTNDILFRVLKYAGYDVTKVTNITDVGHLTNDDDADSSGEDKIAKKAKKEQKDAFEIARYYEEAFLEDEKKLLILPPNHRPRATEYIQEQIDMTTTLIEKGFAYESNGSVYFRTTKFKDYGKLSGNNLDSLIAGARVEVNTEKEHPLDFALWKKADENHLMQWDFRNGKRVNVNGTYYDIDSEPVKIEESNQNSNEVCSNTQRVNLGEDDKDIEMVPDQFRGFPGWHIECSAMSRALLGDYFDIHTGGEDNLFPHHECEIAQNEASSGHKSVNYWLHTKHLLVGGEKMSKSKGNFYTIKDLLNDGWTGPEIRYALLNAHYRSTLNFTLDGLTVARNSIQRINEAYSILTNKASGNASDFVEKSRTKYQEALFDDLNLPEALSVVFSLINEALQAHESETLSASDAQAVVHFLENDFQTIFAVLHKEETVPENIQTLLDARHQARTNKEWAESDRIRDEIKALGYEVLDGKDGQRVKKI